MKILLVDDSKVVRKMLKDALQSYFTDAVFYEAQNGIQAIQTLNNVQFKFMFLDWNMPELDGEGVLDFVRKNMTETKMFTIMVTSEGTKTNVLKAVKKGAHGFVVKPFQKDKLIETVKKVIEENNNLNKKD